ncbi:MAG: hypothetical protein ACI4EJ_00425 [Bacteroides sp.]|nr:hypothetical protein [Clostridia bacterium]
MDNIMHALEMMAAVLIFTVAVRLWMICRNDLVNADAALLNSMMNERIQYFESGR